MREATLTDTDVCRCKDSAEEPHWSNIYYIDQMDLKWYSLNIKVTCLMNAINMLCRKRGIDDWSSWDESGSE